MFAVFFPVVAYSSIDFISRVGLLVVFAILMMALVWHRAWTRPTLQRTSVASGSVALLFFVMLWADFPFWGWPF